MSSPPQDQSNQQQDPIVDNTSADSNNNNNNKDTKSNSNNKKPWQHKKPADAPNDKKAENSKDDKKKGSAAAPAAAATASSSPPPSVAPSPPAATHVAVHFALATRVPKENGGGIMSVAAVCFNADTRTIVATFERNVLPSIDPSKDEYLLLNNSNNNNNNNNNNQAAAASSSSSSSTSSSALESFRQSFLLGKNATSSFSNIMNPDTSGYWGSSTRRKEYRAVTDNAVHPRDMMKDLYDFCKQHGGSRITMVCNPLGAFFSFVLHYQELYLAPLKEYQNPPWGFGALCVRSYCSAALGGIPMAQVAANKKYVEEFCEGFDPNQTLQPIASAVVAAIVFINASSEIINSNKNNNNKNAEDQTLPETNNNNNKFVKWNCPIPAAAAKGYIVPDPVVDIFRLPFVPPVENNNNNNKKQQQQQKHQKEEPKLQQQDPSSSEKRAPQLLLYPSITDADFSVEDVEKTIAAWAHDEHPSIEWIVQEKVHGSNLSIAMDPRNGEVYAARRESPLSLKDGSAFYCFDYLIQDIRSEMAQIVERIKNKFSNSSSSSPLILVQFFGEICGGDYDDKTRVAPVIGASRVQRGVTYAPWHCFYVFDCVVHFLDDSQQPQQQQQQVARYLSYDELDSFFSNINNNNKEEQSVPSTKQLLLAPVLARGTFEELNKNFSCEFESKFPFWVGLPDRQNNHPNSNNNKNSGKLTNFAEGIILRPVRDTDDEPSSRLLPLSVLAKSTSSPQKQKEQEQHQLEKENNSKKKKDNSANANADDDNHNQDQQGQHQAEETNNNDNKFYYYRPLVKKKHPMFREFVSSQQIFDKIPTSELFSRLVTVARVASVISKMTKTERDNEEKVVASMTADIVKDIKEIIKNKNKNNATAEAFDEKNAVQDQNNLNLVATAVRSYFGSGN